MKKTVNIAIQLTGSNAMYDTIFDNGEIAFTTKKGALLIKGDHRSMGRAKTWIAPGMIKDTLEYHKTTVFVVYSWFCDALKFTPITNFKKEDK